MNSCFKKQINRGNHSRYLFVTGMFRSGTTLLARMMAAHPSIAFASDPYISFFNDFRDALARENHLLAGQPSQAPIGDYFADDEGLEIMKIIQKSDLDHVLKPKALQQLIALIDQRAARVTPFISKKLGLLRGRTYRELYQSMMDLVQECYGDKESQLIGVKEAWCTEFIRPLHRTFPSMKSVVIVRDPRAVYASKFSRQNGKYPWLFIGRHWRKLSAFAWLYSTDPKLKDSIFVLRYEDLVTEPERMGRKICAFLGVDYHPDMIDSSKFLDGRERHWKGNSSYRDEATITPDSIEKWKEIFSSEEVRLIEQICYPEMRLFGYKPVSRDADVIAPPDIWNPMIVERTEMAEWIRPFSNTGLAWHVSEMMKEYFRKSLLTLSDIQLESINSQIIESFYGDTRYFEHLLKLMKQISGAPRAYTHVN